MNKGAYVLLTMTILSGIALSSSLAIAEDNEVIDTVELTVPVACTMSGTGQTSHNASLSPGTYSGASGSEYEAGIGKTTITTYCNDNNGFSIYAIGFTGDLYEGESHTKLIGQNTNQSISTKVYANGDTDSNWSMKVTKVDNPASGDPITYNPDNMSIQNSFNSWHTVPDVYTKVAQYNSSTTDPATTDTTLGAKIETTYATYISSSQPADTYTGQVKYTMVHPYDHTAPEPPSFKVLYTGRALSNTPGQENPVTVRMADLPQDGKYNLLGTEMGTYDKLTEGKLYGGVFKYNGNFDSFDNYLQNYQIYNGNNINFDTISASSPILTDCAQLAVQQDTVYFVKESPKEIFLTNYNHWGTSGGAVSPGNWWFFTAMDDQYYYEAGFIITDETRGVTEERKGKKARSLTINIASGSERITAATVNHLATESNVISYWKDVDVIYHTPNNVIRTIDYWVTPDKYKVTGAQERTFYFNDLKSENLVHTENNNLTPTITNLNN